MSRGNTSSKPVTELRQPTERLPHWQTELAKSERACRLLGSIVNRHAEDICRIADVPMDEDGDADFGLAWDRVSGMPSEIARLTRERDEARAALDRVHRLADLIDHQRVPISGDPIRAAIRGDR